MSSIIELNELYHKHGKDFLKDLFDSYLIVFEKLNASDFYMMRSLDKFQFYKKKEEPITLIDRTLNSIYENGIFHFENLPISVIQSLPNNWLFCFDYFTGPHSIYDIIPASRLVLNRILVKELNKTIQIEDPFIISKYASMLGVQENPPLFAGRLDIEKKSKLLDFLTIPDNQLKDSLENISFFKFFFNIIDPVNGHSNKPLLSLHDRFDSIFLKFIKPNGDKTITKITDPDTRYIYTREKLKKETNDIVSLLILDILNFLNDYRSMPTLLGNSPAEKYIHLVCFIYNDYMHIHEKNLQNINFKTGDFAKTDEFKLNYNLIPNKKSREIISRSENNKIIFQIILSTFRKNKNYKNNIILSSFSDDFNKIVNKIIYTIEKENIEFKTFNDYLTLF